MSDYEEKCKLCTHNYKPVDCEPKCNMMCANHEYFKPITNYDMIMKMNEEDLADEFFNWFCNGYCENYVDDFGEVYDNILEWLRSMRLG